MKAWWILAFGPLGWIGMAERAIAHGAVITYKTTQAYALTAAYDNGDPMKGAQVAIFSPDDPQTPWMTTTTDDQGHFLFSPPGPGNWEIQVRQAGHGDLLVIAVDDPAATQDGGATAQEGTEAESQAIAPTGNLSVLQKGLMAGSVVWGFVGTALFFSHGKKR